MGPTATAIWGRCRLAGSSQETDLGLQLLQLCMTSSEAGSCRTLEAFAAQCLDSMHAGQVRQEWNNQKEKEKAKEGTSKEDSRRAAKADQEQVRGLTLCLGCHERSP